MKTITFEDMGQDFLEWDLDASNTVVTSRPLQHSVWAGLTVSKLRLGRKPTIEGKGLERPVCLKYRVIKIENKPAEPIRASRNKGGDVICK